MNRYDIKQCVNKNDINFKPLLYFMKNELKLSINKDFKKLQNVEQNSYDEWYLGVEIDTYNNFVDVSWFTKHKQD